MNKIENMKSIPIKTYDFKVDFRVGEDDIIEDFLDPNQNKHISVPKRPQTAKTSTWGTPKPLAKPFVTKKTKGPNLTIVGTANTDGEPVQANNPLASNIFHFKSHLPVKKLSENPKLALSMFKKKTLGTKSEQVFQGPPENFNKTTGFNSFNQGVPGVYYENKNSIYSENKGGNKPLMNGLNSGKKLTKKSIEELKMRKEQSALKASGAGAGMFQKRLHNGPKRDEEDEEEEEEGGEETKGNKQRPQSAITPGYMKSNKKEKVLKPPKKPEFDWEQDEENQAENNDIENEDNNFSKKRPQPQKEAAKKKTVKVQEPTEEEEAAVDAEFNDDNLMNKDQEEEDLGGTESKGPVTKNKRPKEEKAKPMKPLPKRKPKKMLVGDEDFEEGAEAYDENDADFEGGLEAGEGEEEILAEDGEYNEEAAEENPNDEEAGNEENNEEEEQASQASSKRRFRSNIANMLNELQGGVLTGEPEATFGFQDAEEDYGTQSAPPKKGVKETSNRLLGKEAKEAKSKDLSGAGAKGKFVPYDYLNSVDGNTAQMQREKVTKDVTDYLKAADEKRKKRNEEMGTKKKSYNDDNVQDHNEYSDRMEYVNTRVKAKIAAMRNIIDGSKATTVQQNQILDVEEIHSGDSIEDLDDFERYVKK